MKSAVFDIETSALEGIGAGLLLCACIRPTSTQRTRTLRLDEYVYKPQPEKYGHFERQERDLVKALIEELSKYDLLIGHNIENFDLGYIRTRAYVHSLPCFLTPLTYDTMRAFGRVKFRTVLTRRGRPSASMDMVADMLGIQQEKTKIYPVKHWETVWAKESLRIEAMNNLVDHCQRDVRMNAQIYDVLLPADEKVNLKRWR